MCTVLIAERLGGGYLVAANRDEAHTRPKALPPTVHDEEGVAVLFPVDPLGGGTWISVNEFGLMITLLNGYDFEAPAPKEPPMSRGLVVKKLSISRTLDELHERVQNELNPTLAHVDGFVLLAVALNAEAAPEASRLVWDQVAMRTEAIELPWLEVSSSYEPELARELRSLQLNELLNKPLASHVELLIEFKAHNPERGPFSVCMHRDDAETVSHTGIEVSSKTAEMVYIDEAPCSAAAHSRLIHELPLKRGARENIL